MEETPKKVIFADFDPEGEDFHPTEVESMCPNCGENGLTKILLTKIPHYKEVILMSFNCNHCGNQNNEIQSGSKIQEKGISFRIHIKEMKDLNRQIVRSDFASFSIPEVELEIPANSQKGDITTVEGVVRRTITGLTQDQVLRRALDQEGAEKIDQYVQRLETLLTVETPFDVVLCDISGNSHVENFLAPKSDPSLEVSYFSRNKEQNHLLGIYSQEELQEDDVNHNEEKEDIKEEVLTFPTNCPECNSPSTTNMKVTNIPYFKEVVIMATVCDYCGHKTNEIKSGGGIEPKGTKITLRVTDPSDLNRDLLKSETCSIKIPELDFEIGGYSLGGKFTTLEGLLNNIKDQVENNPLLGGAISGDSRSVATEQRLKEFMDAMDKMIEGNQKFTFIMDDPAGNSFLQNVYAPDNDPELDVERYERSFEQNDMLGLNDMKVEGYEEHDNHLKKEEIVEVENEEKETLLCSNKETPDLISNNNEQQ